MALNLVTVVKDYVQKRNPEKLLEVFLEYMASKSPDSDFLELYEALDYLSTHANDLSHHLTEITEFIFEYLLEHQYYNQLKKFLCEHGNFFTPTAKQRSEIIMFYKTQYAYIENINEILHHSGIYETERLGDAIRAIEKLITFRPSTPVYNSRFGYGEIVKIDWLLDCVVVNFFSGQQHLIPLSSALSILEVLESNNFFYLKIKSPQKIEELILENPERLLTILARDLQKKLTAKDIKELLKDTVNPDLIDKLIKLLKLTSENNTTKRYQKTCKTDKEEINYNDLLSAPSEEIVRILKASPRAQKEKIVEFLLLNNKELVFNLFLNSTDKQIWEIIFNQLPSEHLTSIITRVFNEYRQYPQQFFYLVKSGVFDDKLEILLRHLDLASQKKLASEVRKQIIANNYQLISSALENLDTSQAFKILARINELSNFYPEEKDFIYKLFEKKFGRLNTQKDDWVYHTERAIKLKQEELNRLKYEELPKVAAEVAQARSYGDLRENFEYKAAKEKQKRLFNLITQIEDALKKARPIDFSQIDTTKVSIGTKVTLINDEGKNINYTILGPWDSDLTAGIISYLAPFAQKLLGKTVGDEVLDLEGRRYKILAISKPDLLS
ncbi:MAG: GreA/GreB family elongation factor [candidate division WOR-3 bacterium]